MKEIKYFSVFHRIFRVVHAITVTREMHFPGIEKSENSLKDTQRKNYKGDGYYSILIF